MVDEITEPKQEIIQPTKTYTNDITGFATHFVDLPWQKILILCVFILLLLLILAMVVIYAPDFIKLLFSKW